MLDYQTLIAAREALRREISSDSIHRPGCDSSVFASSPDALMKAYGQLAKIDKEIAEHERRALDVWRRNR